ncbi:MAG TPA: ribosome small subunit-dependent GTPase A [Coprothermobacter proteolyticus]|nr:ribosome small subunit-dependent GTPase A [Coprothermobacter proteolyticus]HOL53132.1 ribosome small subunit-dependent GTPase A [Coprothermobacter proteolyticus]HPO83944.1 ribosome small subunit-dependent GTPase A [Coprothermobacter proteolyticus]
MRALLLGRVLRRERYNVLVSYENSVYLGLVKKKVWEQDKVLVNDRVWFEPITDTEVSVERTAGRKNYFLRPPVANLDLLVYVHSFKNPQCDVRYLDLTLGLATLQNIPVLVLFHKADLLRDEDIQPWTSLYTSLGYDVMVTSVYYDLSALKERLRGKTVLFSGPTGVGKSSLVKALWKDASVRVGDISKVGRGKHTTSWVELLPLDDTYVVDAPGFSLLEMPAMNPWDIQRMFPEIETTAKGCFFSDCLHLKEPSCAVKEAVKKGLIAESRYNSYLYFLDKQQEEAKKR